MPTHDSRWGKLVVVLPGWFGSGPRGVTYPNQQDGLFFSCLSDCLAGCQSKRLDSQRPLLKTESRFRSRRCSRVVLTNLKADYPHFILKWFEIRSEILIFQKLKPKSDFFLLLNLHSWIKIEDVWLLKSQIGTSGAAFQRRVTHLFTSDDQTSSLNHLFEFVNDPQDVFVQFCSCTCLLNVMFAKSD